MSTLLIKKQPWNINFPSWLRSPPSLYFPFFQALFNHFWTRKLAVEKATKPSIFSAGRCCLNPIHPSPLSPKIKHYYHPRQPPFPFTFSLRVIVHHHIPNGGWWWSFPPPLQGRKGERPGRQAGWLLTVRWLACLCVADRCAIVLRVFVSLSLCHSLGLQNQPGGSISPFFRPNSPPPHP